MTATKSKRAKKTEATGRKVLMSCRFNKPSPTKPDGDDGEEKIKMSVIVPLNELSAETAEELLGGKRCEVEFCLRTPKDFQEELPGTEEIISCQSEIKGYNRKMKDWTFAFYVSQEVLDVDTAFKKFWKATGSVRITTIGEIESGDDEPDEPAAKEPKGPSLLD